MGSLRVGADHRPPPAAAAPAVPARGRPERGRAAAAGSHPVHAAAARPAAQPAAGQLPSAAGDHPAADGRRNAAATETPGGFSTWPQVDWSLCVGSSGFPEAAPGSSG